jgi:hypothetical protein
MAPITSGTLNRTTFTGAYPVTPSDTVDLPNGKATGGLFVTVAGNVALIMHGVTLTFTAVPAFTRLPFAADRVKVTGTTATVLACY